MDKSLNSQKIFENRNLRHNEYSTRFLPHRRSQNRSFKFSVEQRKEKLVYENDKQKKPRIFRNILSSCSTASTPPISLTTALSANKLVLSEICSLLSYNKMSFTKRAPFKDISTTASHQRFTNFSKHFGFRGLPLGMQLARIKWDGSVEAPSSVNKATSKWTAEWTFVIKIKMQSLGQ